MRKKESFRRGRKTRIVVNGGGARELWMESTADIMVANPKITENSLLSNSHC
jgi:hypothetical protein